MSHKTISVIIPVYNAEATLKTCVMSVLGQTFHDFDIIIVDDGSTDSSPAICDELQSDNNNVRCIHQKNKGQSLARWCGVEASDAQWITFVDSDDTLARNALEALCSKVSDDTDIVLGNGKSILQEPKDRIPIGVFRHLAVKGEGQIGLVWGCLYRRSVLTANLFDLPTEFRMGEDYIFWLRLVFNTTKPINILYENVYQKGPDTCSSTFSWNSDYIQRIHTLRFEAIPSGERQTYMKEMIEDRIANLFGVAIQQPKKEWINSSFYKELKSDMEQCGFTMPFRQKLFLNLPARWLRKLYSTISERISSR